jgi:fatty-acyl-CoA synthase
MKGVASQADVETIERGARRPAAQSTYELIATTARRYPDARALTFFLRATDHKQAQAWTYRAFFERITATANFFNELGVRANDVVAFVLPNLPETHFTIWGGQAAGVTFAVNPLLESSAIAELLNAGQAKVLVTLAPFPGTDLWAKVQPVLEQVPSLKHVVLVNLADSVRGLRGIAAHAMQKRSVWKLYGKAGVRSAVPRAIGLHDFGRAVDRQPTDRLTSGRRIWADDVSSFFCTGGTTGMPKIAVRTHGNEVANAWSATQVFGDGIGLGKNLFCGLPLFHVNAVLVTGLAAFAQGAHVVLGTPQGYRGEGVIPKFWEIVAHHRIHFFSGVPTLYAALMEHPTTGHDIRSLEYGLCGAAPMPVELIRSFQQMTGLKILEGYGLTEGTCVSSVNPPQGEKRIGSIGLRVPLQEMKAVLLDDSGAYVRDCAPGEVGTLVIKGPNVFVGYKIPAHNLGLWVDVGDGGRWLNTGDLGRQDSEGYFFLTGRKKELIIRGGHNIDPSSIEEPLHRHPAVQLAAAVGRPDIHAGETPVAYVQLKPGSQASVEELMSFAKENIGERAALPKAIYIIDAIPLTGVGKIFKPALKLLQVEDALRTALEAAGVASPQVGAANHPSEGIVVDVKVHGVADEVACKAVLGKFAFRYRLSTVTTAALALSSAA